MESYNTPLPSSSQMRKLAAQGAKPCDVSNGKEIPSDLLAANCIPPGTHPCLSSPLFGAYLAPYLGPI